MNYKKLFLNYLQFEKRYSQHTIISYQTDLDQFEGYARNFFEDEEGLDRAGAKVIRSWIAHMMESGMSVRSVNRKITTLKTFYKFMMREQHIKINPMDKVISPKLKKTLPAFVEEEKMDELLDSHAFGKDFHGARNKLIIELLYLTGMRLSELIQLEDRHIDLYEHTIKVTGKRNKERIIPLEHAAIDIIRNYLNLRKQEISNLKTKGDWLKRQEKTKEILMKVDAQDNSEVSVIAHCIFPNAVKVIHKMDADINIGANARLDYKETHYHGDFGGIQVIPKARVTLGEKALYENTFSLVEGCVGKLDFDYEVISGARSVAELTAKVYGKSDDIIKISEKVHLNGSEARSLIKTRIVLRDKAQAEVIGETYGNAPYARGHVDCTELVNGKEAIARAIPIVSVTDGRAKVTHEAAIGSIDRRQVETLMARGLDESEAVDVIVRGILR